MYFRLRDEERAVMGHHSERPVQYSHEEGGYMASLYVFHELHCLNMIRKFIRPEQYTENHNPDDFKPMHTDHCIETFREVLICKADVSVVTFDWIDDYRHP
jgi:hypothetical protein